MYNNGMKFNPQGSTYWKASKAQQMHARSLLENARAGKPLVSAKAKAANQARKETMAANKAAREKQQAMNKKARAEQRAAQEAKILRRAGISDGSTLDARTTFRRQPDAGLYQYKGLAACKTGDNTYVGLFGPSFDRETQPQTFVYGSSLRNFAAVSHTHSRSFSPTSHVFRSVRCAARAPRPHHPLPASYERRRGRSDGHQRPLPGQRCRRQRQRRRPRPGRSGPGARARHRLRPVGRPGSAPGRRAGTAPRPPSSPVWMTWSAPCTRP
jgi:hypothetical protein